MLSILVTTLHSFPGYVLQHRDTGRTIGKEINNESFATRKEANARQAELNTKAGKRIWAVLHTSDVLNEV